MNTAAGVPRQSLASFWRHPTDTGPAQFECSGVFVGDGRILTVAHAFDDGAPRWVRPYVDGTQAYALVAAPDRHPQLDAAVARVETMPGGAARAELDFTPPGATLEVFLSGYFEGRGEAAYPARWLAFDPAERYHLIDTKQPVGYSGSPVASGDRLWGIATSHFTDANVHRGCVVAVTQLWEGWLDRLLPALAPAPREPMARPAEPHQALRDLVARNRLVEALAALSSLVVAKAPGQADDVVALKGELASLERLHRLGDIPADSYIAGRRRIAVRLLDLATQVDNP